MPLPPALLALLALAVYKTAKERVDKKRQEKESKEKQACPFHPKVNNNLKSEKLAQKAVERYVATSPRLPAVPETGTGESNSDSNGDSNNSSGQTVIAAPGMPAPSPRRLNAVERLYGDAVRRMQK